MGQAEQTTKPEKFSKIPQKRGNFTNFWWCQEINYSNINKSKKRANNWIDTRKND
jgi:hypothetical protein